MMPTSSPPYIPTEALNLVAQRPPTALMDLDQITVALRAHLTTSYGIASSTQLLSDSHHD